MSDLTPITREETLLDGQDLEPITRKEQFIKRIYDKTQEVPTPVTREEYFLKKAGEGTSPVAVEQLNVTENGTYSEQGKAYSPVTVDVPQTTIEPLNITENGTYTAPSGKAYSPIEVNVPSGSALFSPTPSNFNLQGNLVNIDIPEGIEEIQTNAFTNCVLLTDVKFPNSLKVINASFSDASIQDIELKQKLENCSTYAFTRNPMKKVLIKSQRMQDINMISAFQNLNSLEEIRLWSYMPPDYTGTYNFDENCKFYVPAESVDIYKNKYTGIASQIYGVQIQDPSTLIADWDFSSATPLIDSVNGYVLDDNNVSFQDGKAIFRNANSYLKLPISPITDSNIDFYEYEIEISQVNAGTRLFVQSNNFGSSGDVTYGLFFYQNKWQFWSLQSQIIIDDTLSDFDNSTIRVRFEKISNKKASVTIFKDSKVIAGNTNTALVSAQSAEPITNYNTFSLGSHRSSCNMDIKRLRVRTGKYAEV